MSGESERARLVDEATELIWDGLAEQAKFGYVDDDGVIDIGYADSLNMRAIAGSVVDSVLNYVKQQGLPGGLG